MTTERRWDWHMNDVQKEIIRRLADDDRVSIPTLCHRLGKLVLADWLRGLRKRGLLEQINPRVWQLTPKGRRAAREARAELDKTYEAVRQPRRLPEDPLPPPPIRTPPPPRSRA